MSSLVTLATYTPHDSCFSDIRKKGRGVSNFRGTFVFTIKDTTKIVARNFILRRFSALASGPTLSL